MSPESDASFPSTRLANHLAVGQWIPGALEAKKAEIQPLVARSGLPDEKTWGFCTGHVMFFHIFS